jgi:hypothetical protein
MPSTQTGQRYWRYVAQSAISFTPGAIGVLVFAALLVGWAQRDEEYLTPESGLGYWLGIIGSLMMLMLLFYSYRKRQRSSGALWSVPVWFRIHMLLGVFGPLLIVFHSNFHLGALNSNVAFFTMLTVATSGVIGRYIYGKIHMGLYGRKAAANEILEDIKSLREEFGERGRIALPIFDELDAFGRQIIEHKSKTVLESLLFGGAQFFRSRILRANLKVEIRRLAEVEGRAQGWSWWRRRRRVAELTEMVIIYFNALLKAAELKFYERLFSLWHVLHLPLFFLMVLAALVHVWAVHKF